MPGPEDEQVIVEFAIIWISAPAAREWSKRLTSDTTPRDWMHPWVIDDPYLSEHLVGPIYGNRLKLRATFPHFVRTAKADRGMEVIATPFVLADDRTTNLISLTDNQYFAGANRRQDLKLSPGLACWVWSRIEDEQIRFLLYGWIAISG